MDTRYTSRSLRRRRNTDQWECSLSHTDPVTGEVVRTYHTLVAKTQDRQSGYAAPSSWSWSS